ncbi:uncharacterized protein N7459_006660 [Penicillium hispanicum]|uniref:uncharacterized protein n=1 Tax=Penicillium hispanicum TaxID=1080232 RepID=UPI0025402D4B|nr:uncharacterized protein N7459_006660 [Penicillium hispanicum]KAJ5577696.1 hypothetical protein N7459_006660 [Penicillium hispanicum]
MSSFTSKNSTATMSNDDAASTYSTVSTATTLKGTEIPKKKWFSRDPKSSEPKETRKSDEDRAKRALHHEAIASYLSMR